MRKGIVTIDGHCYALVDDLLYKLNSSMQTLLKGREGVSQKILSPVGKKYMDVVWIKLCYMENHAKFPCYSQEAFPALFSYYPIEEHLPPFLWRELKMESRIPKAVA